MDRRAEQVAENEVAHRRLNERIEDSYESHSVEFPMDVICECGREDCDVYLKVNKAPGPLLEGDSSAPIVPAHG